MTRALIVLLIALVVAGTGDYFFNDGHLAARASRQIVGVSIMISHWVLDVTRLS